MTLLFDIAPTCHERTESLDQLLSKDFRQFSIYGIAGMHQALVKLRRFDKCREIEAYVVEMGIDMGKVGFWKPINQ